MAERVLRVVLDVVVRDIDPEDWERIVDPGTGQFLKEDSAISLPAEDLAGCITSGINLNPECFAGTMIYAEFDRSRVLSSHWVSQDGV